MVLVVLLVNVLMVPIGRIGPNGTFPGGSIRGEKNNETKGQFPDGAYRFPMVFFLLFPCVPDGFFPHWFLRYFSEVRLGYSKLPALPAVYTILTNLDLVRPPA